jgi:polysaccharide export outer membrane protein
MDPRGVPLLVAAIAFQGGCASSGSYVSVDDLHDETFTTSAPAGYVIAAGDLLNIRVYNQEAMSGKVRVRADGKIAVPLVGEIDARGRTTEQLSNLLSARLKDYVTLPSVAVTLEEMSPMQVAVVGEVGHPGVFTVQPQAGLLHAIASAGGPTEFSSKNSVFVLRKISRGGPVSRIRFSYDALTRGEGKAPLFALQSGDVVVVE